MAKCYGDLGIVAVATGLACDTDIHDFHRMLHPDLLISTTVQPVKEISMEAQKESRNMLEGFFGSYRVLRDRMGSDADKLMNLRVALFSCTSASLVGPPGYDQELCREIERISGCEYGCTTTTAVLAAFKAANIKKLNIVTPYPDDVADQEVVYFGNAGFPTASINNLSSADINNPFYIMHQDPEMIYDFTVEHFDKSADTVFLSCTGLCVIDIIDRLEQKLGVRVLTSNQCAAWYIGECVGAQRDDAEKFGSLFRVRKD